MSDFRILFSNPWLLLLLIPALLVVFIPFFRIPGKFRGTRNRMISVSLRALAVVLCTSLIAGISFSFTVPNHENEILIVVDASDSNKEQQDLKDTYIQNLINMCGKNYRVGIVTFGYDTVYAAPLSYDSREVYQQYLSAILPDTSATNVAGALEFAAEQFTNPKTSKIVLLSDGLETDETALSVAQIISAQGIKIDTVNFPDEDHGEIQLIDAQMPQEKIVLGQQVNLLLTLESSVEEETNVSITLSDKGYENTPVSVTLKKGEQTVQIPHTFQSAGLHDLLFKIECNKDFLTENNIFQAYLDVSVFEDILILENIDGEASELKEILNENYSVNLLNIHRDADLLPKTAKELCAYQQVILVNIANSDLTDPSMPADFDKALYDYVYNLGGSLLTVGGQNDTGADGTAVPHAYNREDLQGTLFQEMLPVQAIDYTPPIAVMLVIDSSGSMSSERFEAAIKGAEETLDVLNERDFCGVMSFSSSASDAISVLPVSRREEIRDAIRHLGEGEDPSGSGGTIFSGAIDRAGRALAAINDVDRKHIILITDGKPFDHLEETSNNDTNSYGKYIDANYKNGITMSVITVDMGSSSRTQMEDTAERGHGNYYDVANDEPDGTISSYMRQDLASVTISDTEDKLFTPTIKDHTSIFAGMTSTTEIPSLNRYYGTKAKDGATVPLIYEYIPIYASWQFGAGYVGSFMSDLSSTTSPDFIADAIGRQLIKNIAENLAPLQRPEPDRLDFVIKDTTKNYTSRLDIYTDLAEGESVRVTITPQSAEAGSYYASGVPVFPVGNNISFDFNIMCTGVYKILIEKLDAKGVVTSNIALYRTFSYSSEYDAIRPEGEGAELLTQLAQNSGGSVIEDPVQIFSTFTESLSKTYNPALIFLIIAMVCVLLDIAVRKFKFKWLHEIIRDRKAIKELNDSGKHGGEAI